MEDFDVVFSNGGITVDEMGFHRTCSLISLLILQPCQISFLNSVLKLRSTMADAC